MTAVNQPLKAERWWDYKISPLLAIAYYMLSQAKPSVPPISALLHIGLFIIATIGIAGFGYLLNDLLDMEEDKKTHSRNLASQLSRFQLVLLLLLLLAIAWLPWLYLPLGWPGIILIGLEFALFALYSIPPIRLKEQGLPGVVADALYAHVVPLLVAWLTFAHLGGVATPSWFGWLLGMWGLIVGLRHILHHQVYDLSRDRRAGVRTFVIRKGREKTKGLVFWVLGVEVLSFCMLQAVMGYHLPLVVIGFAIYITWQLITVRYTWIQGGFYLSQRAGALGLLILSRFYEGWWPFLILISLTFQTPTYIGLVVLHLFLFRQTLITSIKNDVQNFPKVLAGLRGPT